MGDSTTLRVVVGPVAWFEAEPVVGNSSLSVSFRDISVGDINSWLWNLGDGFQSAEKDPIHTYMTPGVYTVSMQVVGLDGTDTYTRVDLITVQANLVYLPILNK